MRPPLAASVRLLVIVCVLNSLETSAVCEDRGTSAVETSGYWVRPISENLTTCKAGLLAWAWNKADVKPNPFLVNTSGIHPREWKLGPIQSLVTTPDCEVAWIISLDGRNIYSLTKNSDQVDGLANPTPEEITTLVPADDGKTAWVVLKRSPNLMLASRIDRGLKLDAVPGVFNQRSEIIYAVPAAHGKAIWLVPRKARGLITANARGKQTSLQTVDIADVAVSEIAVPDNSESGASRPSEGQAGWAFPTPEAGQGIYVVDAQGTVAPKILSSEEVAQIFADAAQRYVWIKTRSEHLFVATAQMSSRGLRPKLLNDGRPVENAAGKPLPFESLWSSGDGHLVWAVSPSRFGLSKELWILRIVAGVVKSSKADPLSYDHKPIRKVIVDARNQLHAWLQTYDYSIYDVDARGSSPRPIKVLDFAESGILVDEMSSTGVPGRTWLLSSPDSYLMGSAPDRGSRHST